MKNLRSSYSLRRVGAGSVAIVDNDIGMTTVTNDAEAVVEHLLAQFPAAPRIFYRDTMGEWDELKHDGKKFTDFGMLTPQERSGFGLA